MNRRMLPFRRAARAPLVVLLGLAASACQSNRTALVHEPPDRVESRHPIQVAEGVAVLDVLPGAGPGGLTDRQVEDIRAFGGAWRAQGRSRVIVQLPNGGAADGKSLRAMPTIRTALMQAGVPDRAIAQAGYPASGPDHLAPVRLVFAKLEARVPEACGRWPDGSGDGDFMGGIDNRQYFNFGCAYQQNMAAQVADPEDFVRPRAVGRIDAPRRQAVIDKYRQGQSSATVYTDEGAKVSSVGQQ